MNRRVGIAVSIVVAAFAAVGLFGGAGSPRSSRAIGTTTSGAPAFSTSSTASSTSSSTSSSPATTVVGDTGAVGFVPACVPVAATSSAPITTPDPPAMGSFGRLGASPVLDITLPSYRVHQGEAPTITNGSASRVPGGFLVGVGAFDLASFGPLYGASILMVLNDDGSVRWRQCRTDGFAGATYVARGSGVAPTQALLLVANAPDNTNTSGLDFRVVDLADGRDEGSVHDRALAAGLDPSHDVNFPRFGDGRTMLFAGNTAETNDNARKVTANDRIVAVDLATMTVEVLRPPKAALGRTMSDPWLGLTSLGELAIVEGSFDAATQRPVALRHQGKWVDEAGAGAPLWAASFPPRVALTRDGVQPLLVGIDSHATHTWTRTDVIEQGEGAASLTDGSITVAIVCLTPTPAGCAQQGLVGIDTASGTQLWSAVGNFGFGFAGDGFLMAWRGGDASGGTWELLDMHTGLLVAPDQRWPDLHVFFTDVGGFGPGVDITRLSGGMVVASHTGVISVWFPSAVSGSPTKVASVT